jgi:GT2 family glycosyltransferase
MSSARPIKVAVVIAAWKAIPFLDDCLNTLAAADTTGLTLRVFLVDDESPDESAAYAKKHWPWVEADRLDRNAGFAGANNHGIRQAITWGADYVYLLNQDTAVDPGFLQEAVALAEAEPQTGSVQSLLLLHQQPELVNSWGNAIHFLGFGYSLGYKRPRGQAPTEPVDIIYPSGAAVLLRVAALEQVGLLDESLYMYHEDLDLGWRLRLAGWHNRLAPQSVVYHKYEFSRSISKFYYMERNRYLVLFQNLRLWSIAVIAPWLVLSEIGLLLLAVYGGWWRQKVKVYVYFLQPGCWQDISLKRYSVGKLRRVPDREIMAPFVPDISFQEVDGPFTRYVANPVMRLVWRLLKPFIV